MSQKCQNNIRIRENIPLFNLAENLAHCRQYQRKQLSNERQVIWFDLCTSIMEHPFVRKAHGSEREKPFTKGPLPFSFFSHLLNKATRLHSLISTVRVISDLWTFNH